MQMRYAQNGMPPPRQYVQGAPQPFPPQQGQPRVQYVQQQQRPVMAAQPPPRQYVQSAPLPMAQQRPVQGGVYQQVPSSRAVVQTAVPQQQPATKKVTTTTVVKRGGDELDHDVVDLILPPLRVEGQLVANAVLAGFALPTFHVNDSSAYTGLTLAEARVLALRLVATGCFLSAVVFHGMYLQQRGNNSNRSWVFVARLLSIAGMVLLLAAVAVASREMMGEEHETEWIAAVTTMIVVVVIPLLCDIVFCISRLIMSLLDSFDDLFK